MDKDAIVLLNKKSGITSFSCLGTVKHTINKKTGHCGTLDKFANGLMIALCGKFTKLNPAFMGLDKTYEAVIEFGKETDTLDPEGEVINTATLPDLKTIEINVEKLKGEITQIPPVYSALHVNGKRSYELVRSGKEVVLEGRKITIYDACILSYEEPYLTIRLHVSKGTYIRSYARDLGKLCNSCAYVTELKRTQIGPFNLEEAIDADNREALLNYDVHKSEELKKRLEEYNK